jgi:hypothetical protein
VKKMASLAVDKKPIHAAPPTATSSVQHKAKVPVAAAATTIPHKAVTSPSKASTPAATSVSPAKPAVPKAKATPSKP